MYLFTQVHPEKLSKCFLKAAEEKGAKLIIGQVEGIVFSLDNKNSVTGVKVKVCQLLIIFCVKCCIKLCILLCIISLLCTWAYTCLYEVYNITRMCILQHRYLFTMFMFFGSMLYYLAAILTVNGLLISSIEPYLFCRVGRRYHVTL